MDLRPHRPPLPRRTRRLVGEAAALFALLAVAGCKGTGSGASPGPACGDGKLGAGEVCDGAALNGQSCATRGFAGGTLACKGDCSGFDTAGCTTGSTCGDGRLDPGEVCDGAALDGQSCATRGFAGGTLACKGDCSGFDATGCTTGGALPAAAAPTMSPPPGSSTTPVRVTLACSTPGCSVRFTIDGAAITAASPRYADPLTVSSTTVVQAVAVAPGHAPSPVAKGIYVVDPGTGPQLEFHTVRLDAGGAVLPWIPSGHAYAEAVLRNGARLLRFPFAVLNTHAALDWPPGDGVSSGSPNNPAGKNAMIADSALLAYPYTGDRALVDLAVALYDHQLAHGMTGRTGYAWPHVPYASAADGASVFDGASAEEGLHVIEPDKVAEWGLGALRLYEHTGDSTYRDAAVDCADALVQHVVTGSASVSPWPWRVNAETGVTVEGYCAHTAAALELLDELVRLGLGDAGAYAATRSKVWSWTVTVPLASGAWGRYFEDQPTPQAVTNVNQYSPGQLARYLLEHPEKDPAWHAHVDALVAWIESTFAHVEYGANAIAEQAAWNYVMESHTSRYGAVNALLAEATGDAAAHDKAFRALGWATYFMDDDGSTSVMHGTPSTWFTDSHGDFIRHYVIAMAADPAAWAPAGEDHLLRSSSVVTNVSYGPGRVAYETFDAAAREVLRLTFTPTAVQAGGVSLPARADLAAEGWVFDAGTGVLRIRHDASRTVSVSGTVSTP